MSAPISSPILTIALPVFNGGPALRLAVQSIRNQSFEDWELLIIDDGSTDGGTEFLRNQNDPRIKLFRDGHNKGLGARLNEAIQMARGGYFARMDQDDVSHPERFSRQIDFLQANLSVDLLGTRCVTMNEQGRITGVLPSASTHEEICARPWLGIYLPHPTWAAKTDWFRKNPYRSPAPYYCEDQELLLRASTTSRYHAIPEYLLAYSVRADVRWGKSWRTRVSLARVQCAYFFSRGVYAAMSLSMIVAFLRLAFDALRKFAIVVGAPGFLQMRTPAPPSEREFWEELILALKSDRKDQSG